MTANVTDTGDIVTVDDSAPIAVAQTRLADVDGNTLLPAFIDAHSHYVPPAGPGADADAIVSALRNFRDAKRIPPGQTIYAA